MPRRSAGASLITDVAAGRLSRWEERVVSTCGEQTPIPAITRRGWMQSPKKLAAISGQIHGTRADFPDAHFDLVLSNQVLEHVTDPEAVIADIGRLLKPGGTLIAAFPVVSTWYEGHLGLYFAHRLPRGSLRHARLSLLTVLGWVCTAGT